MRYITRHTHRRSHTTGKYLIEFRFHGYAKRALRDLRAAIAGNFHAKTGRRREVPHITIVGPCYTNDEKKLIREVQDVVKEYDMVGFRLGGFGCFPGRAVYANVLPSRDLVEMRQKLVERLGNFCRLQDHDHDPEFSAHSTLCMNTNFPRRAGSGIDQTFEEILKFLDSWKLQETVSYVLRVTVLGGNSRIVCEYDLILKRMLDRKEALDRNISKNTLETFMKKRDARRGGVSCPKPVDESNHPGKVFVVSDLHFDHENIIRFCDRPFGSVREMNRALVDNWNSVVDHNDRVYYLGDLTYGRGRRSIDFWLSKLNGEIRFIRGNHDTDAITRAEVLRDRFHIRYCGHDILLMHDPYRPPTWGGWIIHGDKHNNDLVKYPHINKNSKTINVCAELTGYTPVSLDEIVSRISG